MRPIGWRRLAPGPLRLLRLPTVELERLLGRRFVLTALPVEVDDEIPNGWGLGARRRQDVQHNGFAWASLKLAFRRT